MNKKIITSELCGEKYITATHKSGLRVYICPKPEFSSAYAIFGTRYGSIDTRFRLRGESKFTDVPEGIAHFLEHKLFESEDLDAFERFAETGASANAYTDFDRTCYLFFCSSRFKENFEILLDFVQSPYFTDHSVQKEQGIIGQELRMYDDEPSWRIFFNLLCTMYEQNPVRIDIGGTVESISHITPELLYKCYNTFYNPANMYICVAGNVDPDEVLEMVESGIKDTEPCEIERGEFPEPRGVKQHLIEQKLPVSIPMFSIGYKEECTRPEKTMRERIETGIMLDMIAGKSSMLCNRLIDEGLCNDSFSAYYFTGNGYAAEIFDGESTDPERVRDEIAAEIERQRREGIDREQFRCIKNALYGESIMKYNSIERIGSALINEAVRGDGLFEFSRTISEITPEDIERRLNAQLDEQFRVMSVIRPDGN